MYKIVHLILLCLVTSNFYAVIGEKRAIIITGPESSGSRFIARIVAYVVGKDEYYNKWNGHEINGKMGDDILVIHWSQPAYRPEKFFTLKEFKEKFYQYKLFFIVTTRDRSIINKSKILRWAASDAQLKWHDERSKQILSEIILETNCFIWSYETCLLLGKVYLKKLYDFLQVQSNFFPLDLMDANKKYIK